MNTAILAAVEWVKPLEAERRDVVTGVVDNRNHSRNAAPAVPLGKGVSNLYLGAPFSDLRRSAFAEFL